MGWIRTVAKRLRQGSSIPPGDAWAVGEEELAQRVKAGREIIVVLGKGLTPSVHSWLRDRAHHPSSVTILAGPDTVGGYLIGLVEEGFSVFEAAVPSHRMVFVDRRVGYCVPGLEPIPDAFSLACTLLWRRIGSYGILEGVVEQVNPVFFTLAGNQAVHVHHRGLYRPTAGERVRMLALFSFLARWSTPFPVFACWIDKGGCRAANNAKSGVAPQQSWQGGGQAVM